MSEWTPKKIWKSMTPVRLTDVARMLDDGRVVRVTAPTTIIPTLSFDDAPLKEQNLTGVSAEFRIIETIDSFIVVGRMKPDEPWQIVFE